MDADDDLDARVFDVPIDGEPPCPVVTHRRRFAWWPKRLSTGEVAWLRHYEELSGDGHVVTYRMRRARPRAADLPFRAGGPVETALAYMTDQPMPGAKP